MTIPSPDVEAHSSVQQAIDRLTNVLNGLGIYAGTGDPETVVTAPISAIYRRRDGGVGTSLYVKESDPLGPTGWAAK